MSRLPAFMLTHEVDVEKLTGTTARGSTFAAAISRAAHVEERATLRIDQRRDSETFGELITMRVQVIVQLDREIEPGTRITWLGRSLTAANVGHLEHRAAPSHSELWCV